MKTVCIHQPDFMPWLGFYHRLSQSDLYVVLDSVQFIRQGWQHRDKIKTAQGAHWLTVPVKTRGLNRQLIRDVGIEEKSDWQDLHLKTLRHGYARAPFFDQHYPPIADIYNRHHSQLMQLNLDLMFYFMGAFDIHIEVVFASHFLSIGTKTDLLINLLKKVKATSYISGLGAKAYLQEEKFKESNIDLIWQSYTPNRYPQLHGPFVPGLSAIDFLFNCQDIALRGF
jgi:hypothetical protein